MKKGIILAAIACLSLGLASCNQGGGNPQDSNATPSMVTPSSVEASSSAEATEEEKNFVTPEVTGPKRNIRIELEKLGK